MINYYIDLPTISEFFGGKYFNLFSCYLQYPVEALIRDLVKRGDIFPEDDDLFIVLERIDDQERGFVNALFFVTDLGLDYKKIIMDGVESYFYQLTDEVNLLTASTINLRHKCGFYTIDVGELFREKRNYCDI